MDTFRKSGSDPDFRGTVYLVGAGPGAADLLTLRAARLLAEADIVFHDALVHPDTLALAVRAEKIAVGKRCGRRSTAQQFINKRLLDAARRYRVVVRLKGGDPMIFGRAHEEMSFLRSRGISVEVVPGVTAALAASAELGVSLTRRGLSRSVAFVTPRVGSGEQESAWARAAASADTAAIYMGAGEGPEIAAALIAAGKPASTEARISYATLEQLPRSDRSPVLILIGEVYRESSAEASILAAEMVA